jgi:hypothetical protein
VSHPAWGLRVVESLTSGTYSPTFIADHMLLSCDRSTFWDKLCNFSHDFLLESFPLIIFFSNLIWVQIPVWSYGFRHTHKNEKREKGKIIN